MEPMILIVVAAVVLFATISALISRYKRCPSDKILVIYGRTGGTSAKCVHGGGALQQSAWGLQGLNSMGTFIVTVDTTRELRQTFTEELLACFGNEHQWGLTQKGALFIARYLGSNAAICRKGFEQLWQQLRPKYLNKNAIAPRIWAT